MKNFFPTLSLLILLLTASLAYSAPVSQTTAKMVAFNFIKNIDSNVNSSSMLSLVYTRDEIYLPNVYKKVELNLISPRVELSFSRSVFLTTFWQYNSQAKNINFNGRLQWRFKPMSDLFIVYSDNYNNNDFSIKNRAIVVKFVYWLNM